MLFDFCSEDVGYPDQWQISEIVRLSIIINGLRSGPWFVFILHCEGFAKQGR